MEKAEQKTEVKKVEAEVLEQPKKPRRGDIKKNFWDKMTPEQRAEFIEERRIKTKEKAKQKRLMKDQLKTLLSLPVHDTKAMEVLTKLGLDVEDVDNQMLMLVVMWQQVLKGRANCVPAFNSIVNVLGEGSNALDLNANLNMTFNNDLPQKDEVIEIKENIKELEHE